MSTLCYLWPPISLTSLSQFMMKQCHGSTTACTKFTRRRRMSVSISARILLLPLHGLAQEINGFLAQLGHAKHAPALGSLSLHKSSLSRKLFSFPLCSKFHVSERRTQNYTRRAHASPALSKSVESGIRLILIMSENRFRLTLCRLSLCLFIGVQKLNDKDPHMLSPCFLYSNYLSTYPICPPQSEVAFHQNQLEQASMSCLSVFCPV